MFGVCVCVCLSIFCEARVPSRLLFMSVNVVSIELSISVHVLFNNEIVVCKKYTLLLLFF